MILTDLEERLDERPAKSIKVVRDGLEVTVFRSEIDGRLVVSIDGLNLAESDVHGEFGVPNIRVNIQDCELTFDENGNTHEQEPDRHASAMQKIADIAGTYRRLDQYPAKLIAGMFIPSMEVLRFLGSQYGEY
jgi:hypothetical protein